MKIETMPHRGAGPMMFGMTREEVERGIGHAPRRRLKLHELDLFATDFYEAWSVHFDSCEKCCAIEFVRGATSVLYNGYDLFKHSAREVRDWAKSMDSSMTEKHGFVSIALGLSMYAPMIDAVDLDDDERAECAGGFLVFRRGYYEEKWGRMSKASSP